ncbi:hypothetical protein TNCT_233141 [Trichonephila clavata]|uniref:DUF4817 domain-containing protein n=1 Tax=Trichonephila clavata TaxID=2740835 RepID=A0A8X6KHC1_TRICU|nr:hypothetical protein TNCT_233141 [Trichonephila clavata]
MLPAVLMTVSLVERALLVKLFYENKGNASAAAREFYHRKSLKFRPMSTNDNRAMIKRFEESEKLGVKPGRGRKHITPVLVDSQSQTSEFGSSSTLTELFEKYSET